MSRAPARIRLLVADGENILRQALVGLLAKAADDIEVIGEAADGLEAVERAVARQADVVLMGRDMPGLDGIAATRRLAERAPHVKVVIFAIHDYADDFLLALQAGARGYLLKDASPAEILRAVRAVRRQ